MAPCGGEEDKELSSALAQHMGQEEIEAVHDLWGRLETLLLRGNAAILGNRIPNYPVSTIQPQVLMISMIKSEP